MISQVVIHCVFIDDDGVRPGVGAFFVAIVVTDGYRFVPTAFVVSIVLVALCRSNGRNGQTGRYQQDQSCHKTKGFQRSPPTNGVRDYRYC
jgi:hypothetical protein